jgi:hypothetical protein
LNLFQNRHCRIDHPDDGFFQLTVLSRVGRQGSDQRRKMLRQGGGWWDIVQKLREMS